jgi:hypothetical protein
MVEMGGENTMISRTDFIKVSFSNSFEKRSKVDTGRKRDIK